MAGFIDRFHEVVGRFPSRIAIEVQRRDAVDRLTYSELQALADAYAATLRASGLAAGDRCALLAANDGHWCAAYLGILSLGAVAVPLDTNYSAKQVAVVLCDAGARVLLASPALQSTAADAAAQCGTPCDVLPIGRTQAGAPPLDPVPHPDDAPAVILYTSGTTSDPKGVVLTHANLLAEATAVFQVVDVTERDAVLGVLPLFHALAQMANLLLPFYVGARVVFLEHVTSAELVRALRERECTALCIVPQFFYLIHQRVIQEATAHGAFRRYAFTSLLGLNGWLRDRLGLNLGRVIFAPAHRALGRRMWLLVTGGSKFDPKIARDLRALGFDVLQAYGLTECSGAATVTPPGTWVADSAGRPLPRVDVRVVPVANVPVSRTDEGEVVIRGDIVMRGYYNRPDANAVTLRDGWLHTGDLGYLDARGHLHITGRMKEVIVLSSGKNIYPEEIEAHYSQTPWVKEICVLGLREANAPIAERLFGVIVPNLELARERKIVNLREQLRFEIENLGVHLPPHKRILGFDVWTEDLPRTTTRKLKRFEIERRLLERRAAEPVPTGARGVRLEDWRDDPRVAAALHTVAQAVPHAQLARASNLELDLGLDSMERVELLARMEQQFGASLPEERVQAIYTLGELIDAVLDAAPEAAKADAGDPWRRVLDVAPAEDQFLRELDRGKHAVAAVTFVVLKAVALAARVLLRFRVQGVEHVPDHGPFLVCPNHQSFLDGFLLCCAVPFQKFRQFFFVGASEYYATPVSAWMARKLNIVPVDADANLVRAMQAGAYGLRRGKTLVLFPEGERAIDGEPGRFKRGATILASRLEVPIVPAAFDGLFEVWPRSRPFNWRALLPWSDVRVTLRFGPVLAPAQLRTETGTISDEHAVQVLLSRVKGLLADIRRDPTR